MRSVVPSQQSTLGGRWTPSQTRKYSTPARLALMGAAETSSRLLTDKLCKAKSRGRIAAGREQIYEMALAVEVASYDGTNPRTVGKNDKSSLDFQEFVQFRGWILT